MVANIDNNPVGTEANPSSPHTRRRTSSFLKSLKNKLSTHTEEEEEEEAEEEQEKQEVKEEKSNTTPKYRSAPLQRSHSMKTRSPDKKPQVSSNPTVDRLDLARSASLPNDQKSISAGTTITDYNISLLLTCIAFIT